jgi:hypothetical protein
LQLHELRFAIRSPVSRAEEDDQGTLGAQERLQHTRLTALIAKREVRQARANFWAHILNINFHGIRAGLRLTSPAGTNREQGKAAQQSALSAGERAAHVGGPSLTTIIPNGPPLIPVGGGAWASFEGQALPHVDRLFRLALWIERNRDEAGDLVQELGSLPSCIYER